MTENLTDETRGSPAETVSHAEGDWRHIRWPEPLASCPICLGNPYWGKTLSSWDRCDCVTEQLTAYQRPEGEL